jgi:hypothetical protein
MALLDDLFKGNPLTGIAIGIGAYLLAPTIGPALRPAAKAVIKAGILAYQGLAELGEMASDLAAEAQSELNQPGERERDKEAATSGFGKEMRACWAGQPSKWRPPDVCHFDQALEERRRGDGD